MITLVLIIVCLVKIFPINHSFFKIYFIDVGQGDSTLIVTRTNKTILIDGGGSETGNYDVGGKVLVPYLLDRKIKTVDYMIFSHFDADHAFGLIRTIEELNVKNIILSKQLVKSDTYSSDSIPFADKGIPGLNFMRFGTQGTAHIHTRKDTLYFMSEDALYNTYKYVLK